MRNKLGNGLLLAFLLSAFTGFAQQSNPAAAKPLLKKGNKLYQEKKYQEAQQQYLEALKKAPTDFSGLHNLGDALYQTEQFEPARQTMEASVKHTKDKTQQAQAWHNIGNTYLKEKKWTEAANAFKQALRANPADKDTKYNLAYANAMMKKEKEENDQNKDQNKEQQDKNEEQKDKGDNQDEQNKDQQDKQQDQQPKGQEEQEQTPERPQPQPSKLSQQQAENLLNALMQEEKKLQDKKNKDKGMPVRLEKDW